MKQKIINKIKSIFNYTIINKNLYNRFENYTKKFTEFYNKCFNNNVKYSIEETKINNDKYGYAVTIYDENWFIIIKNFVYDICDENERQFAKLQADELLELLNEK